MFGWVLNAALVILMSLLSRQLLETTIGEESAEWRVQRALRAYALYLPYVPTHPTCPTCPRAQVYFTERKIKNISFNEIK